MSAARRLTDVKGVAEYLATTERHVRDLVYRREVPYLKVGAKVRFDLDMIDGWLDAHTRQAGDFT